MEETLRGLGQFLTGAALTGAIVALMRMFVHRDSRAATVALVNANAEGRRVEAADQVIVRLVKQYDSAIARIDHLEEELVTERVERRTSETNLRVRIFTLETSMRRNGLDIPPESGPAGIGG